MEQLSVKNDRRQAIKTGIVTTRTKKKKTDRVQREGIRRAAEK